MRLLTLLSLFVLQVFAAEPIHSSLSLYLENLDFSNSKQKTDGKLIGMGADLHYKSHELRFGTEAAQTNTIRPQLSEDLKTNKLFLRYAYALDEKTALHLNLLHVAKDNIAPTAYGTAYGAGISYKPNKKSLLSFAQFFTEYKEFEVAQSDLKLEYTFALDALRIKLTSLTHAITLHSYRDNSFSKNGENTYLSSALKLHSHYQNYHFGAAAYTGKRLFAIMNDGFKIQHHAMEFDRTYMAGVGVNIKNYVLRMQYVYQRAEEIPMKNEGVEVRNIRAVVNYKF